MTAVYRNHPYKVNVFGDSQDGSPPPLKLFKAENSLNVHTRYNGQRKIDHGVALKSKRVLYQSG